MRTVALAKGVPGRIGMAKAMQQPPGATRCRHCPTSLEDRSALDLLLELPGQVDESRAVSRYPHKEIGIPVRVCHGIPQRVSVDDGELKLHTTAPEVCPNEADECGVILWLEHLPAE